MAKGVPGVDTATPITAALITQATTFLGQAPVFWGRYFKTAGSAGGVQYNPTNENPIFNANNIRVLPIARQTNHVNRDEDTGNTDGENNAEAIIHAFGADEMARQGQEFLVFLDVEGPPSLSIDYFTGWAKGLAAKAKDLSNSRFELRPCVYALTADNKTWEVLKAADALQIKCYAAWVARLHNDACENGLVDWEPGFLLPKRDLPFPILAWQFAQDCPDKNGFDADQTNPDIDSQNLFLNRLVLPPI